MRTPIVGLLVAGALLVGCPGSSDNPSSPAGGRGGGGAAEPGPSATVSVVDSSGAPGPFAIARLDRLLVDVECAHLSRGTHTVRVAVTSPSGSLYAQLPATLVVSHGRQARASGALQVRGSTIESYRQVGTWQLVAFVDGVPLAAASVELTD